MHSLQHVPDDPSRMSALQAGLRLTLVPETSRLRLNLLTAYERNALGVESGLLQLSAFGERGAWQYGGSLAARARGFEPHLITGQAAFGLSYALYGYRLGVEYVTYLSGSRISQAVLPSVSKDLRNGRVAIKAGPTLGVHRMPSTPMRLSVTGSF